MQYNSHVFCNKKYVKGILTFLTIFFIGLFKGYTQNAPLEEDNAFTQQLWISLAPSWKLKDSTFLKTDVGYRTVSSNDWDRFVARAGYEKTIKPFILKDLKRYESYIGGIGLFHLNNKSGHNSLEIRPFQGYRLNFDLTKRIHLTNYFRLEERFLITAQENSNHFGLRFRYQIMANIGLQGFLFSDKRGFYFPVGIEFFYNIVELSQFSDVIRVTPGAGYQFDRSFKIQGMLAYHYTEQDIGGIYKTNDIIFRLKVIKSF
ncbi:DUF2490 domain-containing protein [Tamlana sp. 2_MG-2023]|uniref:DUF2490 domain-containing protein n=1 Tax=unclassified Tamlana TaxID=2614803 RepID=UPI0026E4054C|nr:MULTISPECIES: DUF2490 domain-containing protein [unclassified Tamlana]MDO6760956.1 DUF2490 domain-containing protein [Tamlana sp. 2_MG-2023]MDO6791212.1 DUF2490 domain-containing protein [Tamlana sp. 1_MG-2023]